MFAGLNGVFLAQDLLLFYFFWEIVLIPIYFLIGIWGGKQSQSKYHFLYLYNLRFVPDAGRNHLYRIPPSARKLSFERHQRTDHPIQRSAAAADFISDRICNQNSALSFAHLAAAGLQGIGYFVTVILSALMAKMGLFAVVNWFIGMFPIKSLNFDWLLYVVGFGLVYASLIALRSNHLKRIIAFSSIAHLALIFMSLFTYSEIGIKGAYFQMFSHGIVVLGMWLSYDYMHRRYGVTDVKSVRGLAKIDPAIAVFWTIFCLSNLSLPLTSNFIGEFSMLNALFLYNPILCVMGCIGAILSAAYTWRMNNAILLGSPNHIRTNRKECRPYSIWYSACCRLQ